MEMVLTYGRETIPLDMNLKAGFFRVMLLFLTHHCSSAETRGTVGAPAVRAASSTNIITLVSITRVPLVI